jgi:hypothetical protein
VIAWLFGYCWGVWVCYCCSGTVSVLLLVVFFFYSTRFIYAQGPLGLEKGRRSRCYGAEAFEIIFVRFEVLVLYITVQVWLYGFYSSIVWVAQFLVGTRMGQDNEL